MKIYHMRRWVIGKNIVEIDKIKKAVDYSFTIF